MEKLALDREIMWRFLRNDCERDKVVLGNLVLNRGLTRLDKYPSIARTHSAILYKER